MAKKKTRKISIEERLEYGGGARLRKGCGWEVTFGPIRRGRSPQNIFKDNIMYVTTDKAMRELLGKYGGYAVPYCVGNVGRRKHYSKKPLMIRCVKPAGKRAECTEARKRPHGGVMRDGTQVKISRPFCLTRTGKRTKSC